MAEDKIHGLRKEIINSDDEAMGISIDYYPKSKEWNINYSDAGSGINATGKDLETAIKNIKKEYKRVYGFEL